MTWQYNNFTVHTVVQLVTHGSHVMKFDVMLDSAPSGWKQLPSKSEFDVILSSLGHKWVEDAPRRGSFRGHEFIAIRYTMED